MKLRLMLFSNKHRDATFTLGPYASLKKQKKCVRIKNILILRSIKPFIKISLFVLLVLLLCSQVVSSLGEMKGKTSFDECNSITALSQEQPNISDRDCIDSKAFSSSSYNTIVLVEQVEEEKKKPKKKSTYAANQRETNALSFLKFVRVQRAVDRIILSNRSLYKLFHSWKIPHL